jgi:ubiquinone/menaquinone biosynthesis C-methylase UbiE
MTYDEPIAARYDTGRAISLDGLASWLGAIGPYLPRSSGLPVLDLGAGTGLFAQAFAQRFDVKVVAVEPSGAMRHMAQETHSHPGITYLEGDAANIPRAADSCAAAWLSTVIHHIPDLPACARELRRVLYRRSPVLIRSAFPGRLGGITLLISSICWSCVRGS